MPTLVGIGVSPSAGRLRVLDFGGAAGLHYLVVKQAFPTRRLAKETETFRFVRNHPVP